jgi:hypothetical protein
MLRRALTALALLTIAGCGASGESVRPRAERHECPPGTRELSVRDVLPAPPAGMVIVPPDERGMKRLTGPLRTALGDRIRSLRIRVVVKRGRVMGTAVIVVNSTESAGDSRGVMRGAQRSAEELGGEAKPVTIGGRPGAVVTAPGGAKASVAIDDCALVLLSGVDEPSVRAVATEIRAPE